MKFYKIIKANFLRQRKSISKYPSKMYFANNNYPSNERFTKVFKKMSSSYQERNSVTHLPQSSTDNSFFGEKSIGLSQDKDTRYTISSKAKSIRTVLPLDEESVLKVFFVEKQVQINRQKRILKTEFVPTSNGLKYILRISQSFYLNLSWLHSVQELQKSKFLILYYDMYHLSQTEITKLPKIQSLIIEFVNEIEMLKMLNAISFIHAKYHDENVQKLYHLLCGDQNKKIK